MDKDLLEEHYKQSTTAIVKNDFKSFKLVFGVHEDFDVNYHVDPSVFKGREDNPFTPIMACAYLNIAECLLYMIDNFKEKINLSATDNFGKNFLYFLVINGNISLLKRVCEKLGAADVLVALNQKSLGNVDTPFLELLSSLGKDDWKEANDFVKTVVHSVDINAVNNNGSTALMLALRAGNYLIADTLLQAYDINMLCKDKDGFSAWDIVDNEVIRPSFGGTFGREAEAYRVSVKAKIFSLYESQLLGSDVKGKGGGSKAFKC